MIDDPRSMDAEDDAIIGRAAWISAAVLLAVAALAAVGYLVTRPRAPAAGGAVQGPPAAGAAAALAAPPPLRFTDITASAGITFLHENGAYGDKLLPETMGGGAAFVDVDNDGDADILFIDSTTWPWRPRGRATPTVVVYRNDGQGHFEEVTAAAGLGERFYGMGVAAADYDGDGWVDLFVTGVGAHRLFHNERGRFVDATARAGLGDGVGRWSTCATWFDFDGDGDLDLVECHYVRWSREIDLRQDFRLTGLGRAYGPPRTFEGDFPALYRNDGRGRFTNVSAAAGVEIRNPATGVPLAKSLGVAPADYDGDGWMDLFVANDTVPNLLFHNERNGTFREVGAEAGVAFDSYGKARSAMGIDAADFRDDGSLGYAIGNFANEMMALYVSQGPGRPFEDEAIQAGVGAATRQSLTFGVLFADVDLDGRLDLLAANGHVEDAINTVQPSQQYAQPPNLFWNSGATASATFVAVDHATLPDLFAPMVGRGVAVADIDGDGDVDVLLTAAGQAPAAAERPDARPPLGAPAPRGRGGQPRRDRGRGRTRRRRRDPPPARDADARLPVAVGAAGHDRARRGRPRRSASDPVAGRRRAGRRRRGDRPPHDDYRGAVAGRITPTEPSIAMAVPKGRDRRWSRSRITFATGAAASRGTPRSAPRAA